MLQLNNLSKKMNEMKLDDDEEEIGQDADIVDAGDAAMELDNGEHDDADSIDFDDAENYPHLLKNKTDYKIDFRSQEDREFEDEIEFDPNTVLAERLKKYRALRSFRNSVWSRYVTIWKEGSN